MAQLTFNFTAACSYQSEDFVVTPSNQEAFSWVTQSTPWTQNTLLLIGPQYSGKTHLATIFQKLFSAVFISQKDLQIYQEDFHSHETPFILDSLDFQASEEPLLHLYNGCREKQRQLLLTAETHPAEWKIKLPDLASRLMAIPYTTIQSPDDALIRGILLKKFSDFQLSISETVLDYLLTHIERSYLGIQETVHSLNEASLAEHKKITLPLVKKILNL
ncbi:MAG: hypothetical protein J0H12_00940 [Candidatus Paracaedimonas acanthamoebae]|uniref:Hda lid domain-containing protein n=1 Tax=Candidatus Paracaedimonas acanthamoebae TaxID=244581 RepID=A0A8J7TT03_9PROT|nr:hypothetical protein [Candidatus Paracaedimonas acanthamoebae]